MKRLLYLLLFFAGWLDASAQYLNVGLFREHRITSAVAYCSKGSFQLVSEGKILARLETGGTLYLTLEKGQIKVLDAQNDYGYVDEIELRALTLDAWFHLKPTSPDLESRVYDDNLIAVAGETALTLINQVDIDKYLAGVVAVDTGPDAGKEFYKAQSILCRTFALRHIDR
ncbi:MAG: SpoIID/LytB domain-containing protein, partial [Bacteroidales bacterium]